jgi:hypothetical protein
VVSLQYTDRGCWLWFGSTFDHGNHPIWSSKFAHRITYEAFFGPIPEGFVLHHRCHTPQCCNPAHLSVMTPSGHSLLHARKRRPQFCKRGHEFTADNTYEYKGHRHCKECGRMHLRARRARLKQEKEAALNG